MDGQKMGLPISKLICGSNQNDILTRFFENGIMKRKNVSPSYSPSMDIQVSSNFERLLYEINGRDTNLVKKQMNGFPMEKTLKSKSEREEYIKKRGLS